MLENAMNNSSSDCVTEKTELSSVYSFKVIIMGLSVVSITICMIYIYIRLQECCKMLNKQ